MRIPRQGHRRPNRPADERPDAPTVSLIAALIAAVSGWGVIHHGKSLMRNGDTLADGGGWTAIILAETMISLGAAAFAIS
jgi:hypothetical protein